MTDNNNTNHEPDVWKNETRYTDKNYNQEQPINNTVRVLDNKFTRLLGLFGILFLLYVGIDIFNTYTHHDRTVINTILESISMLFNK